MKQSGFLTRQKAERQELLNDKILEWDEAIGSRIAERSKGYTLNLRGKQNWRLR